MPEEEQKKVLEAYFGKDGINYSVTRMSLGSCDFAVSPYSYIKENDLTLSTFSLKREKDTVTKLAKLVLSYKKDIYFLTSPWSPVPFMKTNNDYRGGQLKEEYYDLWAKYIRRFIEENKKLGININGLTVQNEPRHHQLWESCNFSKEEEINLVNKSLSRELKDLNTEIYVYDHGGERLFERAKYAYSNSNVDGIAFHWYSGDFFDEISLTRYAYPNKEIIMSEGCVGVPAKSYYDVDQDKQWDIALEYSYKINQYFKYGINRFIDWCLCLNENFGPCHFREDRLANVFAAVICDSQKKKAIFTPAFYAIGQYSKFVDMGAKIIGVSAYKDSLKVVAFKNLDNSLVLVIHNNSLDSCKPVINVDNNIARVSIDPKSITALVIK